MKNNNVFVSLSPILLAVESSHHESNNQGGNSHEGHTGEKSIAVGETIEVVKIKGFKSSPNMF